MFAVVNEVVGKIVVVAFVAAGIVVFLYKKKKYIHLKIFNNKNLSRNKIFYLKILFI